MRIIVDRPLVKYSPELPAIKVTLVTAIPEALTPELAVAPIARRIRPAEQLQIGDCRKWIPREKGTAAVGTLRSMRFHAGGEHLIIFEQASFPDCPRPVFFSLHAAARPGEPVSLAIWFLSSRVPACL